MRIHAGRECLSQAQNEKQPAISKNAAAAKKAIDFNVILPLSLDAAQRPAAYLWRLFRKPSAYVQPIARPPSGVAAGSSKPPGGSSLAFTALAPLNPKGYTDLHLSKLFAGQPRRTSTG